VALPPGERGLLWRSRQGRGDCCGAPARGEGTVVALPPGERGLLWRFRQGRGDCCGGRGDIVASRRECKRRGDPFSMSDTGQLQFKKQVSRYEGAKAIWFSPYAVLAGIQRPASSVCF